MEISNYLYPIRRWWWLLAAATLIAMLSSLLVVITQPPVYQAKTTLMIGRAIENPNPSTNEFWLGQQLASTYADIANREQVRDATMAALGLDWLPQYRARAVDNSQLIEISVTDTEPVRAQAVANELANQLILLTPTSSRPEERDRQEFISAQLDTLEAQIEQTQRDIEQLQTELGTMVSARQISDAQNQISALSGKLTTLQANYANLLASTGKGAINTLTVMEPAGLPTRPIGPNKATAVLAAGMIGLVLAVAAAYLLEYLDDTLKTPQDVERLVGYPVIGQILDEDDASGEQPFVARHPRHPYAEAFRNLRTNLEFSNVDRPVRTILVSSADTGDGKTSIATNLAAIIAQAEKRVILVDADLRIPRIHSFLKIPNKNGLSDVFRGKVSLKDALQVIHEGGMSVITGGTPPPNPGELLASNRMVEILNELQEMADYVVVDAPPFVVADASVLSTRVDGVVLVVRPGYTRKDAVQTMVTQIRRSKARVLGVVLNRIPEELAAYYRGTFYTSPYYHSPYFERREKPKRRSAWQKALQLITRSAADTRQTRVTDGQRAGGRTLSDTDGSIVTPELPKSPE
jgi:succinoglycan biosynthesis transport protein ExoP